MLSPFERTVAWRYLRAKKAEGFVSVIAGFSFLGIMLGVATLIIVMSVMNGFRAELIDRILGLNGHITILSTQGNIQDFKAVQDKLTTIEGIKSIHPVVEKQALLSQKGQATGVIARGITKGGFVQKDELYKGILSGNLESFTGNKAAIGVELASKLKLRVGDSFTLLSPQVKAGPFGAIPRSQRFEVGLVFDVGMYEYNSGFIFIPLDQAQKLFQLKDGVSLLEITTPDPTNLAEIKSLIQLSLPNYMRAVDWQASNSSFYNALQVERNVMFLILTLIIIVAAFNIISSMIMLVKDKSKDIAIMRTIGADRGAILRIFVGTGALIGVAGTLFGAILGISFALNIETIRQFLEGLTGTELFAAEIYFLSQLPAVIDWMEVSSVIIMALILSFGATLYPAWRASRLDPVEVLRYE